MRGTSSYKIKKEFFNIKNCIAVLRRLCITVRRRAIALTYYFEAAGIRRPGGDHGVARIDSWLKFRDYDRVHSWFVLRFSHPWLMGLKHISYVGLSIENKMADYF